MTISISSNSINVGRVSSQKADNSAKSPVNGRADSRSINASHMNTQKKSAKTAKTAIPSVNNKVSTVNPNGKPAVSEREFLTREGLIPNRDGMIAAVRELVSIDGDSYKSKLLNQNIHDAIDDNILTPEGKAAHVEQQIENALASIQSFRLIGSDGKTIQSIRVPAFREELSHTDVVGTDERGRPITYGMTMTRNGFAARDIMNDHYSKYINLNGTGINKLLADSPYKNMSDDEKYRLLLQDMAAKSDYSGLGDVEKYEAIHGKYAQLFGKDFLTAGAIDYHHSNSDYVYKSILQQFDKELSDAFGSMDKAAEAARVALYSDKNESNIRAEIASKYPSGDEMTLRDLFNMTWEMERVGVDGGLRDVVEYATDFNKHIISPPGAIRSIDGHTLMREGLLDQKLDIGFISNAYNRMLNSGKATNETGQIMQDYLSVSIDSNGRAAPNENADSNDWFQHIVNWQINNGIFSDTDGM